MKTIAAISTPLGKGGIGIVRLSGEDSLAIASKVFTAESFSISDVKPNYMYFGYFKGSDFSDKGYMVYFKAPKSFTGEDTVEFQLHGGIRLLEGVVNECVKHGAIPAERGEFTKRAFLNGKLMLSDAEGVIDMINADSAASLRAGFRLMQGYLAKEVVNLESELIDLISSLEASLDYPEEMEDEVLPEIPKIKNSVGSRLEKLIGSASTGKIIKEGIDVALIGEANVGKSSLLNRLVGKDRAIVTDVAGTTRDVIEVSAEYEGVKINFIDTAGIRESDDLVEKFGIEKSKETAKTADAVLNVIDDTLKGKPLYVDNDKPVFNVYNKCDKSGGKFGKSGKNYFISAKTGEGVDELLKDVVKLFLSGETSSGEIITSKRHLSALIRAKQAIDSVDVTAPIDCVLIDLKEALSCLGEITGNNASEEVIDAIFKNFCVGK
ncbi:MAG: tRNA uridine-5-carboxymethylaminomethyl(34) synthesis GTPase MnmE [Christensenellales bacterium]